MPISKAVIQGEVIRRTRIRMRLGPDLPGARMVLQWRRDDPEFNRRYLDARNYATNALVDEIVARAERKGIA